MDKVSLRDRLVAHLSKTNANTGVVTLRSVEWKSFYKDKRQLFINPQGKIRTGMTLAASRLLSVEEYQVILKEMNNAQS